MSTSHIAWHRSEDRAAKTLHRTATPRWTRQAVVAVLVLFAAVLCSQFTAVAQNLGTAPAFGQAVQGQQATTVEGTILNMVNWGCNVVAPVIGVALLGVAGWHYKSGRGYGGWLGSGVALMMISGFGRMAEGFITQAGAIK